MINPKLKFKYADLIFLCASQVLVIFAFLNEITYIVNFNTVTRLIMFALPTDGVSTPGHIKFNGKELIEKWNKENKTFTTFYLSGNVKDDDKCLDVVRCEVRKIKYTYDTMNIIKVHFTSENTYGQFVYLNNMMMEEKIKRYMLYNDDFYIIGNGRPNLSETSLEIKPLLMSNARPLIIY